MLSAGAAVGFKAQAAAGQRKYERYGMKMRGGGGGGGGGGGLFYKTVWKLKDF